LTTKEKTFETPRISNQPLRSLSSPLTRSNPLAPRKNSQSSHMRIKANTLSSDSEGEKEEKCPLGELRLKGFRGQKGGRKVPSAKSRILLAALLPGGSPNGLSPPRTSKSEKKGKSRDRNMEVEDNEVIKVKEVVVALPQGIRYPYCRSLVYPPSEACTASLGPPSNTLSLKHIHGYNNDEKSCSGKNVLYVNNRRIIFPAAHTVVLMDTETSEQGFYTGHTGKVSSLCLHPTGGIVASGQVSGLILVWDLNALRLKTSRTEPLMKLNEGGTEAVQCLSFSSDGKLLVALTCEVPGSTQGICIYDWAKGITIASVSTGHIALQVAFDPYRDFITGDKSPLGSQGSSSEEEYEATYAIVTCGGKVVKFWTLRKDMMEDVSEEGDHGSTNSSLAPSPHHRNSSFNCEYFLEGKAGSWPGGDESACELTCFTFACDLVEGSEAEDGYLSTASRVLCGSETGSIFIWQQSEMTSKEFMGQKIPLPRGKLLSVVTDVHDGPVRDIDYFNSSFTADSVQRETVITCGSDGIVNLWQLERVKDFPLEHIAACTVLETGGCDIGRVIVFSEDGANAVVGSVGSSLLLLSLNGSETDMTATPLLTGHSRVSKLTVRQSIPSSASETSSFFATVSHDDSSLCVWDTSKNMQIARIPMTSPMSLAFIPNGTGIVVGGCDGDLTHIGLKALGSKMNDELNEVEIVMKKNILGRPSTAARTGIRDLVTMKYSPDGKILAVSCGDKMIHLLSVRNSYKRLGVCRGHTACAQTLDFSCDGRILQSTDENSELIFWDVAKAERITDAGSVRDKEWDSWSAPIGWHVQGVFNRDREGLVKETLPPAVCRSHRGDLLTTGGVSLKLFNFPCPPSAGPSVYGGNTTRVTDVAFLPCDTGVIAVSGEGSLLYHWTVSTS
jgi:WD40 repeat protein